VKYSCNYFTDFVLEYLTTQFVLQMKCHQKSSLLPETTTYTNYHYQEQCDNQDHLLHTVFVNVTRLAKLIRFYCNVSTLLLLLEINKYCIVLYIK
jgi:hypothetical protein